MTHAERIDAAVAAFEEAMARFQARLSGAPPADVERVPEDGGWSPAQIAWHVAAVNGSFSSILDGSFPIAKPASDFVERTWEEIGTGVPAKAQAPTRVQPPQRVTRDEAVEKLSASAARLVAAMRALPPDRALLTIDAPLVGRI